MKIAVQLYTLQKECEKDLFGTLAKVAALGFEGVEFAGYFGGYTAKSIKQKLDSLGLEVAGSHVALDQLTRHLEDVILFQKDLGSTHIICPYVEEADRQTKEDYQRLVHQLEGIGKRCYESGIMFSYHNHDFELEDVDGVKPLQMILNATNPAHVRAEFDIYWLTKASEDPSAWIRRYRGRTPLLHLKDMTTDANQEFAELGTGGVDCKDAIEAGKESGVEWLIVEHDHCQREPFESIEISLRYLHHELAIQQRAT